MDLAPAHAKTSVPVRDALVEGRRVSTFYCLSFLSFEYANFKRLGPVASHGSLWEETAVKREQKLSPMLISPQMLRMKKNRYQNNYECRPISK